MPRLGCYWDGCKASEETWIAERSASVSLEEGFARPEVRFDQREVQQR
jgi:hypothetical protein